MKGVLGVAAQWIRDGHEFAMATVVGVVGSAPREPGATMLVRADGVVIGNVSGGCVEAAVIEAGLAVLEGSPAHIVTFGISDDAVFGIGLTCGGTIEVLVRAVQPGSDAAAQLCTLDAASAVDRAGAPPMALVLVVAADAGAAVAGDAYLVGAGAEPLPDRRALSAPLADAAAFVADDRAVALHYDADLCRTERDAAMTLLVIPFGSAPRLIVVGAVEFAVSLARLGSALGYRVTVLDPRSAFATPERFPDAEVVVDWPDRYLAHASIDARTAICVLSHDAKIDVTALAVSLAGPAGYVGAMGSRRTHDDRVERLADAGVSPDRIAALRSPIGLDLGGRTPAETALSILAEIVAVRHGGSGIPLSNRDGPVHQRGADADALTGGRADMPLAACTPSTAPGVRATHGARAART